MPRWGAPEVARRRAASTHGFCEMDANRTTEGTIKMTRSKDSGSADCRALVRQCPRLTREREHELALRWRERGDASARDLLIRSQLRNVVIIARRYRHEACATFDELIAEGNFGL